MAARRPRDLAALRGRRGGTRALFFLLDGDTNASSRHRVLQYLPYLRRGGVEPCVSRPVPQSVYQRLVEASRGGPRGKAAFYGLFLACPLWGVLRAGRFAAGVVLPA